MAILVINIVTIVNIFDIYIVKLTTDPVVTANTGNYTNSYILDYVPENTTTADDIKADQAPVASEGITTDWLLNFPNRGLIIWVC